MIKVCVLRYREDSLEKVRNEIEKILVDVADSWDIKSISIVPCRHWFEQEFLCTIAYEPKQKTSLSIKDIVLKNLNKEMLKNTEFRQALGVHHTKWKDFWNNTFVSNILQELAEDNIYMQEGKRGRKDTVMFYRKVL